MLKEAGDPDWAFLLHIGEGVPLGVDEELPRTPAVYEPKVRWKLEADLGDALPEKSNYASAADHLDAVEAQFREEAKLGCMVNLIR